MCSLRTSSAPRPVSAIEKSGATGSLLPVQRREHRHIRRKTNPWHPSRPFGRVGPSNYTRSKLRTRWAFAILLVNLLAGSLPASAQVLFVDADATGANNGSSWCDAYGFLQDALAAAVSGDTIRVANGTYTPSPCDPGPCSYTSTSPERADTFQLITGVTLEGGYAGCGASDPDARDIVANETILSGDLSGDDLPDFTNNDENSFHVVIGIGSDSTAIFDGFIITAGNADG